MSERILRVNESLRQALSLIFERYVNSEIPDALITIMEVQTAPDLRDAIVRVSVMGGPSSKNKVLRYLRSHRAELQHILSKNIYLKFTPRLDFRIDETLERGSRILEIIDDLKEDPNSPVENEE